MGKTRQSLIVALRFSRQTSNDFKAIKPRPLASRSLMLSRTCGLQCLL